MCANITFFNRLKNEFRTFKALKITRFGISDFLCIFAAKYGFVRECGEIWLLATTLKNAKMLSSGHLIHDRRISIFCFSVRSAFLWGFFVENIKQNI